MKRLPHLISLLAAFSLLAACGGSKETHAKTEPATVENKRPESDLTRITFTDDAVRRTGIETAVLGMREVANERLFTGVVTPAPGASSLVAAPFDGIVTAPKGGLLVPGARVQAGAPVLQLHGVAAQTAGVSPDQAIRVRRLELDNARARLKRTLDLVAAEGASEEDAERARAEVAQAEAAFASVRTQISMDAGANDQGAAVTAPITGLLGDYAVGLGQMVRAGDPLFRVTALENALIRVPVFSSDLEKIADKAPAKILRLGSRAPLTGAVRIDGPPTATTSTSSVDLYFLTEASDIDLRPGERVGVAIAMGETTPRLAAPLSAIFTDIHGGAWVYEAIDAATFARRRVIVDYIAEDVAVLSEGPPAGTKVVTAGVAELAGSEFGVGK